MTLERVVRGLTARGHRLHLVRPRQISDKNGATGDSGSPEQTLVFGLRIPGYRELNFGLPAARRLSRLWAKQRPDVVHVATEGPLGWSALRAAERLGIPVSSSFHTNFHSYGGHYGFGGLRKLALRYLRRFHRRTRVTFAPTAEMCDRLEQDGFGDLRVLGRGVDTELFSAEKRSDALRREWGAGAETLVVGYFGRVAAEKNIHLAARAFLAIREVRPESVFVLVGDGPLATELKQKYPEFHYRGMRRGDDLARHYASVDFFPFPSVTETFGNVITEAMASGVPVLSYDYAAARAFIRDGENGAKAPLDDEKAFLERARQLAADPATLRSMGKQARETALGLSWERVVESFERELMAISGVIETNK